jgi:hypothetical protein
MTCWQHQVTTTISAAGNPAGNSAGSKTKHSVIGGAEVAPSGPSSYARPMILVSAGGAGGLSRRLMLAAFNGPPFLVRA